MNRQTIEMIAGVNELDEAFDKWAGLKIGTEEEFEARKLMAQAVGKVKGLAYILEHETRPFSSFQHSEHLYGTENSRG